MKSEIAPLAIAEPIFVTILAAAGAAVTAAGAAAKAAIPEVATNACRYLPVLLAKLTVVLFDTGRTFLAKSNLSSEPS